MKNKSYLIGFHLTTNENFDQLVKKKEKIIALVQKKFISNAFKGKNITLKLKVESY